MASVFSSDGTERSGKLASGKKLASSGSVSLAAWYSVLVDATSRGSGGGAELLMVKYVVKKRCMDAMCEFCCCYKNDFLSMIESI